MLRRPPDDLTVYELALRGLARKHRFTKEDYLAGRAELERAVALDPDYAPALLNLAFLDTVDIGMQITGERTPAHLDGAIARLRRVTEIDPRLPTAYQALSLALTIAGDTEGALVAARRAVELGPGDAENLLFASRAEASVGNFARSLELAEEAVTRNPVAPAYFDSFHGRAWYGAGNTDAAISSFRSCLAKSPGYHSCRAFLAASLVAAGRLEEAQREIAELGRRAPTYDLKVVPVDIGFPGVPELTTRLVAQLREAGLPDAKQPARS